MTDPKPLTADAATRIMRNYIWPEEMSGAAAYDIEKAKLLRGRIAATIDAQAATIRELRAALDKAAVWRHDWAEHYDRGGTLSYETCDASSCTEARAALAAAEGGSDA